MKQSSEQILSMNQDEVSYYLKDLRRLKVMTPERERELSKIMTSGNLTNDERKKIETELLEGNLRFVISVAKQYQNQGLELSDLIAEGNYGLIKAIRGFDWSKNLRFISYAVWWVRQSIIQSLNEHTRTIRLPVNVVQDLQKAKREIEHTNDELSEKLGSLPTTIKLDDKLNEDGDTLIDVLINHNAGNPEEVFSTKEELKVKLYEILSELDEREKTIIECYFGLNGTELTLEEIGDILDLTKERVRQIKEKALRKIRNNALVLFDYI